MSWIVFTAFQVLENFITASTFLDIYSICGFQGTCLTEFYQSLANSINSNPLITGKNQLYGTALPCWSRLTHSLTQASPLSPPIGTCPFYIKHSFEWVFFFKESGTHLLSHTVSSIVPSAAWVLTNVFGMGTGVSPKRIGTRNSLSFTLKQKTQQYIKPLLLLP